MTPSPVSAPMTVTVVAQNTIGTPLRQTVRYGDCRTRGCGRLEQSLPTNAVGKRVRRT
ncbi:hypothetical protein NJ7G_2934 [Natrinema sp. J7-2]|nr:hypothetical protein NJ7G_2934 [Natrinema sp. J7-2]